LIVVAGAVANKLHNGGEAWVRLSWALGLKRLGYEVFLLEQISPDVCVDTTGQRSAVQDSENLRYFRAVVSRFGFDGHAALITDDGSVVWGLDRPTLEAMADAATLLVNISGNLRFAPLLRCFRRRAYIDIDPGYTQFWHAQGALGSAIEDHDSWFTVGENIGRSDCPVPTGGIPWQRVRQPVVLDDWPVSPALDSQRMTTIGAWRGAYGTVEFDGRRYGARAHEWRKLLPLPALAPSTFEAALHIDPADHADRDALIGHGWNLVDPRAVASTPDDFRRYVQGSGGEFGVAQGLYVDTRCGWFSDRTVRYLAAGKPVLVQDTGFGASLPVGEGLLAFRDLPGAVEGSKRIDADYATHSRAARRIAETYFDSDIVLPGFLEESGALA